ncbi:MAG: HD domain-containing protein [Thermotogae bacterium]|jgi:polar amino acid transport system substrate-binding protein|nr:HD domain-containing protein [Thermotogota bacterium]MCL5031645.1 HD domain-containing protein [Thermotogota bacterium]
MNDPLILDYFIATVVVEAAIVLVLFIFCRGKLKGFVEKIRELTVKNENLKKNEFELRKEIKNTKSALEDVESRFGKISKIIQGFSQIAQKNYSEFFDDLLDLALSVVPEAKSGSISVIDGKQWKFMAIRGNGKDAGKLKFLDLKSEWMVAIPKITVVEDISKANEKNVPKVYSNMIEEAVGGHIYRSIAIPLKLGNDFIGNCFLDALSDIKFSESSKMAMENFAVLASTFLTLKKLEILPQLSINNTLREIVNFYEMKDPVTRGHSENVAYFAVKIGEKMNLSPKQIGDLYWAAIFHDIGLISIPDEIARKSSMTKAEFEIMKIHTLIGEKIIDPYDHLKEAAIVARSHHECFDGSGYPDGIKGFDIPLLSRIVSVSDLFDTLRKNSKPGISVSDVINEIKEKSGTQFDPEIVKVAIQIFETVKK